MNLGPLGWDSTVVIRSQHCIVREYWDMAFGDHFDSFRTGILLDKQMGGLLQQNLITML